MEFDKIKLKGKVDTIEHETKAVRIAGDSREFIYEQPLESLLDNAFVNDLDVVAWIDTTPVQKRWVYHGTVVKVKVA